MINIESIKAKIRNLAKNNNLSSQEVLQMFLFERLSKSEYRSNFGMKGGFRGSSLIGINNRTTMDMDSTIKGLPLTEENITKVVNSLINKY